MWQHKVRVKAMAHLEMMRPYTMFHAGMVAVAGAELASRGHITLWRLALAGAVTICGWEAGLYAGDYFDRELDAHSKPDRAIPSGRVSPREAFLTMVVLIGVGYVCALMLGAANLALAVLTTVLGVAYSKAFKSRAILGNFDRGVLGVCAALFGALAGGSLLAAPVLLFSAVVFLHDSATNLVGTIRDIDGDRAAGYATVPVVYGREHAVSVTVWLACCWALLGCALTASLMAANGPTPLALALFVLALGIAARVYVPLWVARRQVSRSRALTAHKYLVVERLVLMSAFFAVYTSAMVALALLGATVVLSVGAQVLLRDRYERQHITQPNIGGGYAHSG
jgi:4-hydroxybenzoate polyprenyltransferase/geranylgeranylglycerol-phosphate geranylgeranyltransferase